MIATSRNSHLPVYQRFLLLLERVLQLDLLSTQLLQIRLLCRSLGLQLLDLAHQLVDHVLLLLLERLLQLHFLTSQLVELARQVVSQEFLLSLVVVRERLFLFLQRLDLLKQFVRDVFFFLFCSSLVVYKEREKKGMIVKNNFKLCSFVIIQ